MGRNLGCATGVTPFQIMRFRRAAAAPPAGLAIVQSDKGLSTSPGTTAAINGKTTTTGSTILLACIHEAGKTITFSDNKGNTYASIGTQQTESGGTAIDWVYKENATGGGSHDFLATASASDYLVLFMVEIAGLVASPLDANVQTSIVGSQPYGSTAPTGTLAQANEILFFLIGTSFNGPYADANNTLLHKEDNATLYYTGGLSYAIVSATTSRAASWTLGGSSSAALKACSFKGA